VTQQATLQLWSFRCGRCSAGGVTGRYDDSKVCDSCGCDMFVWPCGNPSPWHGWHGPFLRKRGARITQRAGDKKRRRKWRQDGEH
jgi:hypothetical protein